MCKTRHGQCQADSPQIDGTPPNARLQQRLAEVRILQEISPRTVARNLKISLSQVRACEQGDADLRLSELYQWAGVLGVPAEELLVEPSDGLARPLQLRAQLLSIMKTVLAIRGRARTQATRYQVEQLVEQLVEIMPELRTIVDNHVVDNNV